ncbi:hypothetical protein [Helicobacter labacensis]|uniref:hypothetical protein n=1 Tax=Helicobacter labacensis TaxID=2316079 RepID=UPI000EACD315|nr:hypothetical protein [Helicobacter labacensis]
MGEVIHEELKITQRGHRFVIRETEEESRIKQIHLCFDANDFVFILRQLDDEEKECIDGNDKLKKHISKKRIIKRHTINFFTDKNCATDCRCDGIIFKFNKGFLPQIKSRQCVSTAFRSQSMDLHFLQFFRLNKLTPFEADLDSRVHARAQVFNPFKKRSFLIF